MLPSTGSNLMGFYNQIGNHYTGISDRKRWGTAKIPGERPPNFILRNNL